MLLEGEGSLEVAAVAQRAGVSESLAYYHFRNNPHLLVSMILGGVLAGVNHALEAARPKSKRRIQREIWSFVARAAGIDRD